MSFFILIISMLYKVPLHTLPYKVRTNHSLYTGCPEKSVKPQIQNKKCFSQRVNIRKWKKLSLVKVIDLDHKMSPRECPSSSVTHQWVRSCSWPQGHHPRMVFIIHLSPSSTQLAVHTIRTRLCETFPSKLSLGVCHWVTILGVQKTYNSS